VARSRSQAARAVVSRHDHQVRLSFVVGGQEEIAREEKTTTNMAHRTRKHSVTNIKKDKHKPLS